MAKASGFPGSFLLCIVLSLCVFESAVSLYVSIKGLEIFFKCGVSPIPYETNFENLPLDAPWEKIIPAVVYFTYFKPSDDSIICVDVPLKTNPVQRTYYWILIYFIVNGLWMITSALSLLCATCAKVKVNQYSRFYLYYPWTLSFLIVISTDLVASIQYSLDLLYVNDIENYYHFIGCQKSEYLQLNSNSSQDVINSAPITMAILFSRGIIIWLLNVLLVMITIRFLKHQPPVKHIITSETNTGTNEEVHPGTSAVESDITGCPAPEPNYVPWVNLLYIPSLWKEYEYSSNNENLPENNDEHQYEHQYEKVTYPQGVPDIINIQVPSNISSESQFYHLAGYYNIPEPKPLNIDYGSISIHIKRNKPQFPLSFPVIRVNNSEVQHPTTNCSAQSTQEATIF